MAVSKEYFKTRQTIVNIRLTIMLAILSKTVVQIGYSF